MTLFTEQMFLLNFWPFMSGLDKCIMNCKGMNKKGFNKICLKFRFSKEKNGGLNNC